MSRSTITPAITVTSSETETQLLKSTPLGVHGLGPGFASKALQDSFLSWFSREDTEDLLNAVIQSVVNPQAFSEVSSPKKTSHLTIPTSPELQGRGMGKPPVSPTSSPQGKGSPRTSVKQDEEGSGSTSPGSSSKKAAQNSVFTFDVEDVSGMQPDTNAAVLNLTQQQPETQLEAVDDYKRSPEKVRGSVEEAKEPEAPVYSPLKITTAETTATSTAGTPPSPQRSTGDTKQRDTPPAIGQFYFPDGAPLSPGKAANVDALITNVFAQQFQRRAEALKQNGHTLAQREADRKRGITVYDFFEVTMHVCKLASYCNALLFQRVYYASPFRKHPPLKTRSVSSNAISTIKLDQDGNPETDLYALGEQESRPKQVTEADFRHFWTTHLEKHDLNTRFFVLLLDQDFQDGDDSKTLRDTKRDAPLYRRYLVREDFKPIVLEIVERHPGLEFLEDTPQFQDRYGQTVIERIFYQVNTCGSGQMSLTELKRSNFLSTLLLLDDEHDVNRINDYFSYEHFYVIYCKFWELDSDHDFMIDVHDLLKYEDCSLTYTMCNRVANGYARKLFSGEPGKMSYEDFVVFLISEVDKTSKTAISYWFNALDLDYDGYITKYEIQHFFAEQQERLQSLSQGDVLFEDILCQLLDIVQKGNPQFSSTGEDLSCSISRQDLLDCKNAPIFLNTLFNLNQLLIAEQRDPQRQAQILSTPQLSPWDRYAISGYIMLAEIDDEEDEYIDDEDLLGGEVGLEAWEQSVRDMQQSQNFAVGSA